MHDESGSALITALIATILMLGLGLALLAIVDTQANQSAQERTRDRGFNLSESVLTSEAFVLGRSWPNATLAGDPMCGVGGAGFDDTIGQSTGATDAAARLRTNLDASYASDTAYNGATWQVNICDDIDPDGDGPIEGSTIWDETLLTSQKAYDKNDNNRVWVRAQSTVPNATGRDHTRVVVGLVSVRTTSAFDPRFGLVSGSLRQDLSSTLGTVTNAEVAGGLIGELLNASPQVAEDPSENPAFPPPKSGVTGLRCGLLDNVGELKTCVAGALAALSNIDLVDDLVTGERLEQYPSTSSTSSSTPGQLRSQAKSPGGIYMPTAPGSGSRANAPSCEIIAPSNPDTVVFIEKVGTGDQFCVLNVSASVRYKALVIGSGRVIIRGNGSVAPYVEPTPAVPNPTNPNNLFTGVIYALNLQTDQTNPASVGTTRELVRIDKGARVRGAVHADGKNAQVGLIPPPFKTDDLIDSLLCNPPLGGLICSLLKPILNGLGITNLVDALVNGGTCGGLLNLVCLPAIDPAVIISSITSQIGGYGSAIHSDIAVASALEVYGASGVVSGSFRDLAAR